MSAFLSKVKINEKHKIWERKRKTITEIEEISRRKAHTNTQKLIQNILTVTDVFLNQERVHVYKHTAHVNILESF